MILNYFKTTLRNLQRHLSYTLINLMGLTVGLATAIFIFLWIIDSYKFDRHYSDYQRIYSVVTNLRYTDGSINSGTFTSGPLAESLSRDFPEIEFAGRTSNGSTHLLRVGDKSFLAEGIRADPSIFTIFGYEILSGNKKLPMPDRNSIVLTKATATRFFGNVDVVGKLFRVDEQQDYLVTAVIEDVDAHSNLRFDFIIPNTTYYEENQWMAEWGNFNDRTFVKVSADANVEALNSKLETYLKTKCSECDASIWLQLYADQYLYGQYENGKVAGGRIEYVQLFVLIATLILVIACINFMNLATARSATRSREIGVRKVVGAGRQGLIVQFIGESMMLAAVALMLSLVLVQLLLPAFNSLTEKNTTLDFSNVVFTSSVIGVTLFTGLLAGSYPAFFLSSFKPALVLKGNLKQTFQGASLRKGLVVFQFVMSVVLVISSLVIFRQVQFIQQTNLGFNRFNLITFPLRDSVGNNREAFKSQALQHHAVMNMTFAGQNPFEDGWTTSNVKWEGKDPTARVSFRMINTDEDFLNTLDMSLVAGRNFDNPLRDSVGYIINEAALDIIGYQDPIGKPLDVWENPHGKIIGIVRNFHNTHFEQAIAPQIIMCRPQNSWRVFVRVDEQNRQAALEHLEKIHKQFDPQYPFDYAFMDDQFRAQYKMEKTFEHLSLYFTIVAVFISALGLLGLASFTSERRSKELGIRKILGASVGGLIRMLCGDLTKQVAIALVVAIPLAYYLMDKFLDRYVYHTELHWSIFAGASAFIMIVAIGTVVYQSAKAALINPTESLRNE